ncbi:MAG TPA: hypothetical protein DCW29_23485 [Janthinobacterium sp.]|nr:hypothetical protein [Janthinobacterium sp.]
MLHAALAGLCFMTMAAGHAQDTRGGDPARWYVEDATPQEQMRTLRKEIGAALQEAQADCRRGPARERSACMKEARSIYEQDMANAQQQRAAAHPRR